MASIENKGPDKCLLIVSDGFNNTGKRIKPKNKLKTQWFGYIHIDRSEFHIGNRLTIFGKTPTAFL